MSIILAADTSTSINTVAVCDGARLLAESVVECRRLHSERLIGTIDFVLREAGVSQGEIELLAVSRGPGSFTGLRIGVATWKGLAFGLGKPLIGVPTLDALAASGCFPGCTVCPMLDARMKEVFAAAFRVERGVRMRLLPDRVCAPGAFLDALPAAGDGPLVFTGDGASLYRDVIGARFPRAQFAPPHCSVPRASAVAAEGFALWQAGACTDAGLLSPVYLRMSQAEMNRAQAGGAAVS